jgi:hypothetical protein
MPKTSTTRRVTLKKLFTGIAAFLIAALISAPALVHAQATDPASMVDALTTALNSYDEAAVGKLLTEDAVLSYTSSAVNIGGAEFQGRESILELMPALASDTVHYEVIGTPGVSGDTVTWRWRETSKTTTGYGIDFLEYDMEGVVSGDMFQSITFTFTEESVAKIHAALAAQGGVGMPTTGNSSALNYGWLAMASILAALSGFGIRQYSRRAH